MKKLILFVLLIVCCSCTTQDYQKVDSLLGLDSILTFKDIHPYYIQKDSASFSPFSAKTFDSSAVAQKANAIKEKVLKPKIIVIPKRKYPKPIKDGWRSNPELVRRVEEAKAFEEAKRKINEIYHPQAKKDTIRIRNIQKLKP